MKRDSIEIIQKHKVEKIKAVAKRLADDPDADVHADLRQLDTFQTFLEISAAGQTHNRLWGAGVALFSLMIAGLFYAIPLQNTAVVLRLKTDTVAFQLSEDWSPRPEELDILPLSSVRMSALNQIEVPAQGISETNNHGDVRVTLSGERLKLRQLHIGKGGRLQIESHIRSLHLYVYDEPMSGELEMLGQVKLVTEIKRNKNESKSWVFPIPEKLFFEKNNRGIIPSILEFQPLGTLRIYNIQVNTLKFTREAASHPGSSMIVSDIVEGKITLPYISKTVPLYKHDWLTMDSIRGRIIKLEANNGINLLFEGYASVIKIGQEKTARDLSPSILEYLYHNKPLAFFWSTVAFIGSLLWSLKKFFFT